MSKKILISFIVFLTSLSSLFAWGSRGHMLIAAITYSQFSEEQQNKAVEILKHHPYFETKWKDYCGEESNPNFGIYLFMQSSKWADAIKWKGNQNHKMSIPTAHYITYEMRFSYDSTNQKTSLIEGPLVLNEPDIPNVISQLKIEIEKVNDLSLSKEKRAMALSWVIHLIGDIHQPLHCASLFNETVPKGDKGGNKSYVLVDDEVKNLHGIWDYAFFLKRDFDFIINKAEEINKKFSESLPNLEYDPKAWSIESYNLAFEYAYLQGALNISHTKEKALPPPDDYIKNVEEIAGKQMVIAGYRMKEVIADLNLN
jgi:hypothetical protein